MKLKTIGKSLKLAIFLWLIKASNVWAAKGESKDVTAATNDFSERTLEIFKGPLVKILAGIVLFVGVGGLLRGKHQVAVSCGIAFVLLLFLPIILQYFGG